MRSLSRVLTVRFSLTMLLGLLLIGLWAFLGMRLALNDRLDRGIRAAAGLQGAAMAANLPIAFQQPWSGDDQFIRDVNRFVVVRDSTGRAVGGNTPASPTIPMDSAAFSAALDGDQGWARHKWRDRSMRSLFAKVPDGGRSDWAVMQVSASLEHVERIQTAVFWLMIVTVLVTTGATWLGAGWLAQSSTAPIGEIIAQADTITAGTLGDRITAHADVNEYRDLVRVLNEMLTRLDGAHQAQRRIIADTGHDIRTPITAMQGQLEVTLRSERTPQQYRQVLESCLEDVEHLVTISDSLMLLARLEAGEVQPTIRPTEVTPLIARAANYAGGRESDRTIQTEVEDDVAAPIDGDMLQIALNHLMGNAVQHTPPQTHVLVRAAQSDGELVITVEDDGPGIATDVLPKLFERMYRGDDARSRTGGTGLGLAITEEIVKAHGGSATASPSELGGLRIMIRLPLHREARAPAVV